ncbi:MAG: hypothetical protein VKK62_04085 [Synechococcaceae cyanobacterium]|nr:hypothetical protein [Synechococcaceae cyanobacterium]
MPSLLLILMGLGLLLLLLSGDWRSSLLYTIFVGFAQDPLRKITPDQPGLYVGLVLIAAVITVISAYLARGSLQLKQMVSGNRTLVDLFPIFVGLVIIQCFNSFARYGSLTLTGVGLGFYAAPILALWLGFQFSQRPQDVPKLMKLYILMAILFSITVAMSFWGYSNPIFKEVGKGVFIHFDELGMAIQGHVGLWRSSEIAAWHLGAASCFTLILGITTRRTEWIAISALLATMLLGVSVMTGRRKVISLVIGFVAIYGVMISWKAGRTSRDNFIAGLGIAVILIGMFLIGGGDDTLQGNTFGAFLRRGGTVWGDINDRFNELGVGTIRSAIDKAGLGGLGVGAANQGGNQSLGLKVTGAYIGGAGEGGLGKIVLELGLLGLGIVGMLGFTLVRHYFRILNGRLIRYPDYALLNIGLIAFLAANVPVFIVASQVYSDPFVLLILGLCGGFVLGVPSVIASTEQRRLEAAEQAELARLSLPHQDPA